MSQILTLIDSFGTAAIFVGVYMTLWFVYATIRSRNDVADIAWGIGFVGIAWVLFREYSVQAVLILAFVTLWGFRLAGHIAVRNTAKGEDFRYAEWRRTWGKIFYVRSFVQIFMLQGLLMLLISVPVIAVLGVGGYSVVPQGIWLVTTIAGALIWINGFIFEAGGDYQLKKFLANPENKGKIMTQGLWKYTRHPNYFGEVSQWWGIYLIALPNPLWWVLLIGPLTISFLILKVSGIPMLEKKYEGNAEFEVYKSKTNAFFPWKPRN